MDGVSILMAIEMGYPYYIISIPSNIHRHVLVGGLEHVLCSPIFGIII